MDFLEEYRVKLEKLENYLDFAIELSNECGGQQDVPWHLVRANQLFIRMTTTCMSFIRLLPFNRYFPSEVEFWDLTSLLSIARNFIEAYIMLFYVSLDDISNEEKELRLKILNYHLNSEKYKVYKEVDISNEALTHCEELIREFEVNLPAARIEIEKDPLFNRIVEDRSKKRKILEGREAKYLSNKEIIERIPFRTEEFKSLYRFYSNQTHTMPYSFFVISNDRGNGMRNEIEVLHISSAIDFITKYLLASTIGTMKLFPFTMNKMDRPKLEIIISEAYLYGSKIIVPKPLILSS